MYFLFFNSPFEKVKHEEEQAARARDRRRDVALQLKCLDSVTTSGGARAAVCTRPNVVTHSEMSTVDIFNQVLSVGRQVGGDEKMQRG